MIKRPFYESKIDRTQEQSVKWLLENGLIGKGYKAVKLRPQDRVDFCLLKNGTKDIWAWVEVKSRKVSVATYPSYFLSLSKWLVGLALARETGRPFFLVFKFIDKIVYINSDWVVGINARRWWPELGGRTDRGDPADIEPLALIDAGWFKELC